MTVTGLHHILLTVRDAQRSADFYTQVLGLHVAKRLAGETTPLAKVICALPDGRLVGFVQHPSSDPVDTFDELRIGLDHLAFTVAADDLDTWSRRLSEAGIEHTPPAPSAFGDPLITFRDPDNIQVQIYGVETALLPSGRTRG